MSQRLPSVFLSHGLSIAQQFAAVGEAWAEVSRSLPKPSALLVTSADWETNVPMLSGAQPETIHLRDSTAGSLELAQRARTLLGHAGFVAGINGLRAPDHDTWAPLLCAYQAGLPVVQLSVQPPLGLGHHMALGNALRTLSGEGVLIVGSGHLADEDFSPFFIALGAAAQDAKPERVYTQIEPGALPIEAYVFQ